MRRVLVTGATGFIGRHMVQGLAEAGHAVLPVARKAVSGGHGDARVVLGNDATTSLSGAIAWHAIDAIVHTAGVINGTPEAVRAGNDGFTNLLLDAITASGRSPDIIFLSSVSAIEQLGAYGASKRAAEDAIRSRAPGRHLILRPSLVHGPGDRKNVAALVNAVRRWPAIPVIGGDKVKLQPLYVGDLVRVVLAALDGLGSSGGVYTISGPRQERLVDMIRGIQDRVGRHAPLVPVPLALVQSTIGLAARLLPFINLPVQQVVALREHPMYRTEAAARDLGFSPRPFGESIAEYVN